MSLKERLTADMKTALKARDKPRLSTVRLLLAAVQNEEIAKRGPLTEPDEVALMSRQAKQRRDSIEAFDKGGRADLAAKERQELTVIADYLPQQLTKAEVERLLDEIIAEVGATTKRDSGRVMGKLMPKIKGRFPGKDVKPMVQARLDG